MYTNTHARQSIVVRHPSSTSRQSRLAPNRVYAPRALTPPLANAHDARARTRRDASPIVASRPHLPAHAHRAPIPLRTVVANRAPSVWNIQNVEYSASGGANHRIIIIIIITPLTPLTRRRRSHVVVVVVVVVPARVRSSSPIARFRRRVAQTSSSVRRRRRRRRPQRCDASCRRVVGRAREIAIDRWRDRFDVDVDIDVDSIRSMARSIDRSIDGWMDEI